MNFIRRIRTALTVLKFIEEHGHTLEWSTPAFDAAGQRCGIHIYHAGVGGDLVSDILGAANPKTHRHP